MQGELLGEVYLRGSKYGAFMVRNIQPFSGVFIQKPDNTADHYGCDAGFWTLQTFTEITAEDFASARVKTA